jgi:hypothetical protein
LNWRPSNTMDVGSAWQRCWRKGCCAWQAEIFKHRCTALPARSSASKTRSTAAAAASAPACRGVARNVVQSAVHRDVSGGTSADDRRRQGRGITARGECSITTGVWRLGVRYPLCFVLLRTVSMLARLTNSFTAPLCHQHADRLRGRQKPACHPSRRAFSLPSHCHRSFRRLGWFRHDARRVTRSGTMIAQGWRVITARAAASS